MARVQFIRRYISERTKRRFEVEMTVAHPTLSAGQITEAASAEADRRAERVARGFGDVFRLVNEFEGVGMEMIHAE